MNNKIYSNQQILNVVDDMLKLCNNENSLKLKNLNEREYRKIVINKFQEFFEIYPSIFNLICDNPQNFNKNRLLNMLNMRNDVDKNKISYEDASKQIGLEYYNEFVKPYINE